ncbi:MAG: helix-hairpin-helix domain-containing protein [Cryobacterium sp.]|jgi:competence protein ComEA|nr:helix-hairpin-helix domain-containing protein [Cryobacterium sp.]
MPPPDPLAASRTGRFRVGLGAAVVLLIIGVAVTVLVTALSSSAGNRTTVGASRPAASPSVSAPPAGAAIFVHILGAVKSPGLYELRDGDRAIDVIAAAGGYTENADRRQLNLARFLSDGEQIYVPIEGEAIPTGSPGSSASAMSGGKVNLNTADAAALETLPRVGPALASRILAWREANGRFTSIEDLLGVSGIGDKTFAGLKDLVTI